MAGVAGIGAGSRVEGLHPRAGRSWSPLARALAATGDRWTLMIALALAPERLRVTQLRRRLPGVSTGVLERYVQQMAALGLLERTRFKEMPPRVELELTRAGHELVPVAASLARWGFRNMWSAPREGEEVDVDVLLSLLPALLDPDAKLPDGRLASHVNDSDPPLQRLYSAREGALSLEDRGIAPTPSRLTEQPTATIEGDRAAWIAAFSPGGDRSKLRVSGDAQLPDAMFAALWR